MDRSARGVRVSVWLALSLAGMGSVTPGGGSTCAALARVPVAEGATGAVQGKVTRALTGSATVVARARLPLAGRATLPPPLLAVASQLAAVTPAGTGSDTLAPVTALGPWLLTTMV